MHLKRHWNLKLCLFLLYFCYCNRKYYDAHTCISCLLRIKALSYLSISAQNVFWSCFFFYSFEVIHSLFWFNYSYYQIYQWGCVRHTHTRTHTPDVSGQVPCMRPNIFPQALDTAAIFASTGKLWMTNETSLRCCFANVCAWPRMPKPVMSVAACALNVCMRLAAVRENREPTHDFEYTIM